MFSLKEKLESKLSPAVRSVLHTVSQNKKDVNIYLVGGVVRDLLLDKEIFDVDITVEGDAIKLARSLENKGIGTIKQIQKDLRTAKMKFDNGIEIDFASTRKESYPRKGHLPVTTEIGVSLKDDVQRRDFTVNSLALSLNEEDYGDVKDYVNGLSDLEAKQLRILHDNSFIDDPTRIIRGLKFSVRFGFELESHTKKLQDDYLTNHLNPDMCQSRIKSELIQTFSLNIPKAYDLFVQQGIYKLINSDYKAGFESESAKMMIDKYEPKHTWMVYAAPVLLDSKCLDGFGLTKSEKKIVYDLKKILSAKLSSDKLGIYKFFKGIALESILSFYALTKRTSAVLYLDELRHVKPLLSGSDLIKLGFAPSSEFGEIFDSILKEKLEGSLPRKEDEEEFVKSKLID